VIMNLASPLLDKVGLQKPIEAKQEKKLPKPKFFSSIQTTECIRCGLCVRSCCHNLSPILIKEAFDKGKKEKLASLRADLCDGCGHCNYVCPSRINLKNTVLRVKVSMQKNS
jgi:Na+-translocating ferredoxin:NAD+ oxidoreductase RnfC subunit